MDKLAHTEELDFLIIRSQAGDLDAFGTIVLRFQDMAVGYAYSILGDFHLAQDAAQEAFIEAYRNITKVYGAVVFPAWFRRIIFKNCDRLTRRINPQTVELDQAIQLPSTEKNPQEAIEDAEMKQKVLSAIQSLPEEERAVTTLFYINGYTYNEISNFLEMPKTTIDNHLRSARKQLKKKIVATVEDVLHTEQPSKDQKFNTKVQFFNAVEVRDMDKVKELLNTDEAHAALYNFLKKHAKEEGKTVEELVVWLIEQYKKNIESQEALTQIFREKVESKEKQEALHTIEGFYKKAKFSNVAILDIARMIPKAEHNISVITHAAYLAGTFGYHTLSVMQIARIASTSDQECQELSEIADLVVMKLSETGKIVQLGELAIKAKSDEERKLVKQKIGEIKASADYKSLEEALEGQAHMGF